MFKVHRVAKWTNISRRVTCFCVMLSTSISLSERRKLVSDIIPFADFHDTSLMPLSTTIHSHTVCTGFGGFANERISVTSFLSRSSSARRAASNAGSACASTSSASVYTHKYNIFSSGSVLYRIETFRLAASKNILLLLFTFNSRLEAHAVIYNGKNIIADKN